MTTDELKAEWQYRYQERLGILCGNATPGQEQVDLAFKEATEQSVLLKAELSTSA